MRVALVNTNRIRPPIAPIGLEYVAEALCAAGHRVGLLDLCWEEHWEDAVRRFFRASQFGLVGMSLRNTDDCALASRQSFLGDFARMVSSVRGQTGAPIVVGGVGFSVMPEQVLSACAADAGVWSDGELAMARIAEKAPGGVEWSDLPNLVHRTASGWVRNAPEPFPLQDLPPMSRTWVDNRRYFTEGGQAGIETKRGCPRSCVYCADPVAKGAQVRARPPRDVVDEMEALLAQGTDHLHTCDSEFNFPEEHARAVCADAARRGLGEKLRWYAYCSPVPFSRELARNLREAGCAGINFGADSGDADMLRRLGRDFGAEDIATAVRLCRQEGIATMVDLLFGAPGESERSIRHTIELMRRAAPDRVGIAAGVRVYPGTALAARLRGTKDGLVGGTGLHDPLFFMEPAVAKDINGILGRLIGDDERYFFFNPENPAKNYNYNANELLQKAIRDGHRGAYWDILRRLE